MHHLNIKLSWTLSLIGTFEGWLYLVWNSLGVSLRNSHELVKLFSLEISVVTQSIQTKQSALLLFETLWSFKFPGDTNIFYGYGLDVVLSGYALVMHAAFWGLCCWAFSQAWTCYPCRVQSLPRWRSGWMFGWRRSARCWWRWQELHSTIQKLAEDAFWWTFDGVHCQRCSLW